MTRKNNMLFSTPVYSKGKSQKEALMQAWSHESRRMGIDPGAGVALSVSDVPSSLQIAFGSSTDAECSLHANKSFDIHLGAVNDLLLIP